MRFDLGGQTGWAHDEGHPYGSFHTFDALNVGAADQPHKVHVFLPRSYAAADRRYPVLYLLEGNTAFWPGGIAQQTWDVGGVLSSLAAEGRIRELIVVAIHPVNRDQEYTHADWAEGTRDWGGLDDFLRYLADDLKPWVDRNYATAPGPRDTALVGAAHGGLAALYAACSRPGAFGKAGCVSPSFWAGLSSAPGSPPFAALVSSALLDVVNATLQDPAVRPQVWIDWGLKRDGGAHNQEMEALTALHAQQMAQLLEDAYGYWRQPFADHAPVDPFADLFTYADPIGGHDEAAWSWRFRLLTQAFFPSRPGEASLAGPVNGSPTSF